MEERDLEAEEPLARLGVDQLRAALGELDDGCVDVGHLVCDVVHPGPALCEEAADRGVVAERREQLDAAFADEYGCRLDARLLHGRAMLELRAEEARVRVDGLVEVVDRDAEMVDAARMHARDASYAVWATGSPAGSISRKAALKKP
jgi:hypothetical protein